MQPLGREVASGLSAQGSGHVAWAPAADALVYFTNLDGRIAAQSSTHMAFANAAPAPPKKRYQAIQKAHAKPPPAPNTKKKVQQWE